MRQTQSNEGSGAKYTLNMVLEDAVERLESWLKYVGTVLRLSHSLK